MAFTHYGAKITINLDYFKFLLYFGENIGKNIGAESRRRTAELEKQLESTGQKLADKRDKLKTADRQLAELQDELDALREKRDNAQKNFHEFTEKN